MSASTNWRKAATGDFAKKGKWDNGRPGIHADAVIAATGADYVVKVISADAAHSLTLNSPTRHSWKRCMDRSMSAHWM